MGATQSGGSPVRSPQTYPQGPRKDDIRGAARLKLAQIKGPPAAWARGIASHSGIGPRHVWKCFAGRQPRKGDSHSRRPGRSCVAGGWRWAAATVASSVVAFIFFFTRALRIRVPPAGRAPSAAPQL